MPTYSRIMGGEPCTVVVSQADHVNSADLELLKVAFQICYLRWDAKS